MSAPVPTSSPTVDPDAAYKSYFERVKLVEAAYADYMAVLKQAQKRTNTCGPHCDSFVMHRSWRCEFCTNYPELHQARMKMGIAFTGEEPIEGMRPCPATLLRPVEKINRWGGNVAQPVGQAATPPAPQPEMLSSVVITIPTGTWVITY